MVQKKCRFCGCKFHKGWSKCPVCGANLEAGAIVRNVKRGVWKNKYLDKATQERIREKWRYFKLYGKLPKI